MFSSKRRYLRGAAMCAALAVAAGTAFAAPGPIAQGPSTTTDPYILPVGEGVSITSLLTVGGTLAPGEAGTTGDGYRMAGIPDGLGAYRDGESKHFTLLANHELTSSVGAVRKHGQMGAFVGEYGIDGGSLAVDTGRDLIDPGVRYYDYATGTYGTTSSLPAFSRFCSSSLTAPGILFSNRSGNGFGGQIYFANEENGDTGRVFGVTVNGQAQQLPYLGQASWENTQVADTGTDVTLSIGDEDGPSNGSQLWVHRGTKQASGNGFDRAGLTNGTLSVVDLADEAVDNDTEFRATYGKGTAVRFTLGAGEEVNWDQDGAALNTEALGKGLSLSRIEDGNFDPKHPNDYYFITTENGDRTADPADPAGTARDGGGLWRLRFKDVRRPELGGTLELLLDGSEQPLLNKPDNMTIDTKGNLLIQEDPGNNAHLARIVAYNTHNGDRGVVAQFDPARFGTGGSAFITQDEESSGIIDAADLIGNGWFLFDAQVHAANADADRVEYGQFMAMQIPRFDRIYTIRR